MYKKLFLILKQNMRIPGVKKMNDIELNKYFNLDEFECPCCHTVKLDSNLLFKLTIFRMIVSKPFIVTSGYRCPSYNNQINGDRNSYHLQGMAADIQVNVSLDTLYKQAIEIGFTGIGYYEKKKFLHLDVRPGAKHFWKGK